jgi:very-short-patch-repair endonuclease
MKQKQKATVHEQRLYDALVGRGISTELGYNDGHKTVDMAVLPARLYIEVDDLGHFTNPDQIERDFKRHHFSDGDDFDTFYVTNQIIDKFVDRVADAMAEVVKRRMEKLK